MSMGVLKEKEYDWMREIIKNQNNETVFFWTISNYYDIQDYFSFFVPKKILKENWNRGVLVVIIVSSKCVFWPPDTLPRNNISLSLVSDRIFFSFLLLEFY